MAIDEVTMNKMIRDIRNLSNEEYQDLLDQAEEFPMLEGMMFRGPFLRNTPTTDGFYLVKRGACHEVEVAKIGRYQDGSDWWIHFWCHQESDPMTVSEIGNAQYYGPIEWPMQ